MSSVELYRCMLCRDGEQAYFSRAAPHVFKPRRCTVMANGECKYVHELRDALLPRRDHRAPGGTKFFGKRVAVWVGQKYDPEVRGLADAYAVNVPDYELPDWYH